MAESSAQHERANGLNERIAELHTRVAEATSSRERAKLDDELKKLGREFAAGLAPIERVRLARHAMRPQTLEYVGLLIDEFFEIHGDRRFGDDGAIVAGLGYFRRSPVAIVGHQRGRSTRERLERNFGRPHPEGYRKAARVYELANRFSLPLITFIDTQGAEPGVGAEQRGQAEAIAAALELMARLEVPVIACVVGEGGSGGALALGVANVVLMQEYACYSVITPEGCAAILWRNQGPEKVADAAAALRLSAADLDGLGLIDEIVPEPPGGAHHAPTAAAQALGEAIERHLKRLSKLRPTQVRQARAARLSAAGGKFLEIRRVENPDGVG